MAGGLVLEAMADLQKSKFKRKNPDLFCNTGLYKIVRCPNYLGEILIWVGSFTAGIAAFTNPLFAIMAGIGLVCIVLIMMGSTKRLEQRQDERYGHLDKYQDFVNKVPVLFPFLPIYSLKNVKVYLE